MQWIVGLDALRAFAMIIIVAYHFFHSFGWLTGGFIFIELFFVVSGYLLATKILRQQQKTGKVSILRLILHRLVRLWPMLILTILLALAAACFTPHELLAGLRADSLAAATFSTNIVEIIAGKGYENTISPNLFEHLWFVGLELQLCILLPIILALTLSGKKRRASLRRSLIVTSLLALCSVALMVLYGAVWEQTERAYFAIDTQAFAFLGGAALAIWRELKPFAPRRRRFWAKASIVLGLLILMVLSFKIHYGEAEVFYFALPFVALVGVVLLDAVLCLQRRRTILSGFLRPLEFLGKYSFSLYLVHYPAMILLARVLHVPTAARFLITLLVCVLAALLLEWLQAALVRRSKIAILALFLLVIPATITLLAAPSESPILQEISQNRGEEEGITIRYVVEPDTSGIEQILNERSQYAEEANNRLEGGEVSAATSASDAKVLIIGDSVTLGAKAEMEQLIPGAFVDAEESRGIEKAVPILNQLAASGKIPEVVVVSLTTNERYFSDEIMSAVVEAARGSRVIFVTGYAGPDQPRETQNDAIRSFADSHDNVFYADWWQIAHDNWDIMYADHIHLDIEGRAIYAQLLYTTIMNTGGLK